MKKKEPNLMWGGRFDTDPSNIMQSINSSIHFDKNLAFQDIACSKAHVKMLFKKKIIKEEIYKKIFNGLKVIEIEIKEKKFNFIEELEDIHMNIEYRLFQLIGDVSGWLHTARSRSDQVATDFKLWVIY